MDHSDDLREGILPATHLLPGDYVDLESCPHLFDHATASRAYARVTTVERLRDRTVIGYDGIDTVDYPIMATLKMLRDTKRPLTLPSGW